MAVSICLEWATQKARAEIDGWLYLGSSVPKDPVIDKVIESYGGWGRIGSLTYDQLQLILSDLDERVESIYQCQIMNS